MGENTTHINKRTKLDTLQCVLLALSPILHMYRFVSIITLGELALVICLLIGFRTRVVLNKVNKLILGLLVYFFVASLISTLLLRGEFSLFIKEYLPFCVYYVIAIFVIQSVNLNKFISVYCKIAFIVSVFVIVQYLSSVLLNRTISGLIPNMITYAGNMTNFYIGRSAYRCAGFFTEPAMCARYLSMPLIIEMYKVREKKVLLDLRMIILTVAILFTYSGNGIIAIVIAYGMYAFLLIKDRNHKSFGKLLLLLLGAIVAIIVLLQIPSFARLFARVNEITGKGAFKSGYIRVVRGFVGYVNLPLVYQLFGVGFGNYSLVIQRYLYGVLTSQTTLVVGWLNGFQTYLIYGGLVGAVLYLSLILNGLKKQDPVKRTICILLLAYLFLAGIFAEPLWLIFIVIMFSDSQISLNNKYCV